MSENSFSSSLRESKTKFLQDLKENNDLSSYFIVTGNGAGDLDSISSAISFAHFASTTSSTYLPLISSPPQDFKLRPENILAFTSVDLSPDAILSPADVDLKSFWKGIGGFVLVDHNKLEDRFKNSEGEYPTVVGVIDHHEDEKLYQNATPRNIVTPIGSCISLVTKYFVDASSDELQIPTPIADLAIQTILLDTSDLKKAPDGKAEPTDVDSFNHLLKYSSFALPNPGILQPFKVTTDSIFKQLKQAKSDVVSLSSRDLLRRDYKEYSSNNITWGLSTVVIGLSTWLSRNSSVSNPIESFIASLDSYAQEHNLDLIGVLNSFRSPEDKHRRELLVFISSSGMKKKLDRKVFHHNLSDNEVLELKKWELDLPKKEQKKWEDKLDKFAKGGDNWKVWRQKNKDASRKQVAPILQQVIES